ncbi:MAG: hypothetical protein JXA83_14665 [Acidimicrobiales bacterium]|nr:hypothetical protein [Acidimicrobiales bacterium]
MRRRPLLAAVGLTAAALALFTVPSAAAAVARPAALAGVTVAGSGPVQEPDAPADDGTGGSADEVGEEPLQGDDIIPKPNSGRHPAEAGDRGGALQVLVLGLIVAGVGGIAAMVMRESRRNRRDQPSGPYSSQAP